jgi:EVE domain-containing protein
MDPHHYFIAIAPRDALDAAVAAGYVEVNHGKAAPLERMRNGDALLFYSPRESEGGNALQAFTALARIRGDALYQAGVEGDSERPFRRPADYLDVQPVLIRPLIDALAFIRNKAQWGAPLRFGFVQVSRADFACIAQAMGCDVASAFALPPVDGEADAAFVALEGGGDAAADIAAADR